MEGNAKPCILVVDDESKRLGAVEQILSGKYAVFTAADGERALAILRKEPIDAILCEMKLSNMSGVELLRQAHAICPQAVRLVLTDTNRVEDVSEAINVAKVNRIVARSLRAVDFLATVEGAIHEALLERFDRTLQGVVEEEATELLLRVKVANTELTEKNRLLERALSDVQAHESKLEAEVARQTSELRRNMEALRELAVRDGLTGLYNHRFFQEALTSEIARAARHSRKFSLVFLDVDHFKNYNDMLGHPAGDELLRSLATILANTAETAEIRIRGRVSDVVARYGGEEFVIILPEADKPGGMLRADRLRVQVAEFPFKGRESQPGGKVTVSIGVSTFPSDAITKQGLIEAADNALLLAKRQGRNRVVAAGDEPG